MCRIRGKPQAAVARGDAIPLRCAHAAHPPDDDRPPIPMTSPTIRTALSVNLNKGALVRNTRNLGIPSVVRAATVGLEAAADGVTVHPRPDARHIRAGDVRELRSLLQAWPDAEFNIEGN